MKFSIKDFFSKCDQIRSFLRIWSHLLKKSVMENIVQFGKLFLYSGVALYHHYQLERIYRVKKNHQKDTSKKPVAGRINRFLTQQHFY